ncbi:MAG TPA: ribonuclease R [Longimicrobiales bacterium]|nr:ribonuclease R [Longimicrobiales bacterium]
MDKTAEAIIRHLQTEAQHPLKSKELARAVGVEEADYPEFKEALGRLVDEGLLYRVKGQRYAVPKKINLVVGQLQTIRSGAGFVNPEEGTDVFIPPNGLGSALDGDRVVARVERRRRGDRPEGRIIKVLERARETVVGVYHPSRSFGFVVAEDQKITRDVFVPPGQEGGAKDGDVVVVRVTSWGDTQRGPAGEVERVLGRFGDPGVDVLAVAYGHELPLDFPADVDREADRLARRGIRPEDLEGRRDLRGQLVFTIDPAEAKDHDDALSIRPDEDGLWEVGVHIADVSHYVEEGGVIDQEAFLRGTSVYMVDRVVPMLPEALSADLCSLRPHEDRLAVSLLLRMNDDAEVRGQELVRSVIRSAHKLSYDDAQAVLDGGRSASEEVRDSLAALLGLSRKLRAKRAERGSIDFDLPEARVVLNTAGEPTDIQRVLRLETHKLIEDFMILANEVVDREAGRRRLPFLHRVHEPPDPDRIETLRTFLGSLGVRVPEKPAPRDLQKALAKFDDRPEESLVSTVVLRSMKRARYSEKPLGHYGLATDHYTHFTSPIRRYSDLVVHRILTRAFVAGERIPEELRTELLPGVARRTSERERVAVDAERDSVDLKKVEFMQQHVGDAFEGTISGVTSFGLFILLDRFFVEGLVHVSSLEDDYYVFLEEQFALVGENRKRRFRLGDRLRVRVAGVDLENRKIDFALLDDAPSTTPPERTQAL